MLKEKNIRPDLLMKKAKIFFKKDLEYLLSKKKSFVKSNCPACNSKNKKLFLKKNCFLYFSCEKCKTFYSTPRPCEKTLNIFYKNSKLYDYWIEHIFPATEKIRYKKIFSPRATKIVQICKKFKIKRDKILDIGAGFGTFCSVLKKKSLFKKVMALELNDEAAKEMLKKNIDVINKPLEKLTAKDLGDINVFTLFEVIEHLHNPYNFLLKIKKIASKQALVIFTCPNGMGFDISFLGKNSESIDHEHLNYFNPKSVYNLAKRAGFEVLQVTTPGTLDVDILKNKYECGEFLTKNNFFPQIFEDQEKIKGLQNFLINNNLSSNMWVVLRKK